MTVLTPIVRRRHRLFLASLLLSVSVCVLVSIRMYLPVTHIHTRRDTHNRLEPNTDYLIYGPGNIEACIIHLLENLR